MRRRVVTAGALAGVVLVGGGGVAYAQMQSSSGSYRTAVVSTGDVDRTMNLSGTITSSSRRDLSFGAAGHVTKVSVAVGDKVHSGEVLASLDATDLKNAVTKATAALASARAKLDSDENAQSATVATATATTSSPSSSSSKDATPAQSSKPSPVLMAALAEVKKQQLAVTTAQTDATSAITAAKAALTAQKAACTDGDTPADPPSDPPSDPTPTPAPAATPTPTAGLPETCGTALDTVQTAQDVVAVKQNTLQSALEALAKTLNDALLAVQNASSSTGSPAGSASSSSSPGSSSSSVGSTGSTSRTAGSSGSSSAGSLAQDQAAIDTAAAQLTEAKLAVDSATLTAPYSGRILSVSVSMAKGDQVGASETAMVLVGDGGTTATTTVTADQVTGIKKGQTAEVTPAGAAERVAGTVTSIGLLPDSSGSVVTYPVTIDLADGVTAPEGTNASIAVLTGTAKNVLTIPSSALTKMGTRAIVLVLKNGQEQPTPVTVGIVGSTRTSITEGLTKGQTVIIADLNAALPSGDTTNNRFGGLVRPGGAGGGGRAGGGGNGGGGDGGGNR